MTSPTYSIAHNGCYDWEVWEDHDDFFVASCPSEAAAEMVVEGLQLRQQSLERVSDYRMTHTTVSTSSSSVAYLSLAAAPVPFWRRLLQRLVPSRLLLCRGDCLWEWYDADWNPREDKMYFRDPLCLKHGERVSD